MMNITTDRADGSRRGRTTSHLLSEESKKPGTERKTGTRKTAETTRKAETARKAETTKKHANMQHLKWL